MPPGEECPAGAVETMAARGITEGSVAYSPRSDDDPRSITVKEGWTTGWYWVGAGKGLPGGGAVLSGRVHFCGERVCIRFTEARLKREGRTIPVCLEAWDEGKRGTGRMPGSTEDNVTISWGAYAKAEKRFE
jgi:hypothetical protein